MHKLLATVQWNSRQYAEMGATNAVQREVFRPSRGGKYDRLVHISGSPVYLDKQLQFSKVDLSDLDEHRVKNYIFYLMFNESF